MSHPQVVRRAVAVWVAGIATLIAVGLALRQAARPLGHDDLAAVAGLSRHRAEGLTAAAHALSVAGRSWVLVPLAIVVGLAARRLPARALPLVAVLGAIVVQDAVKAIVARPRPPVHRLEQLTSSSFPSGHATETTAFVVAVCVLAWPLVRATAARAAAVSLAVLAAGAVCGARIYLGVHYPTDVAAGALLGAGCAVLARAVLIPVSGSRPSCDRDGPFTSP